ncbi:LAMI_0H13916g1_1 [Lachancea mirantina]|uniref:LAMI_0H13916g1_1 n=1 Tax=Lachancea mirantina TaxID=1230905 RepID=A0A1G4KIE7_9SACH|nr:LAMI_0H13916g1_1 [Lachancea mirantina]
MKLLSWCTVTVLSLLATAKADASVQTSVSCGTVPTGGTLDSTPHSSRTATILKNGVPMVGVYEYYSSLTFVVNCSPTSSAGANAIITIY